MRFTSLIPLFLSISLGLAVPTPTTELEERQQICSVGVTPARSAQIRAAFTSSGVVPTLIPDIQPRLEVSVSYGSKQVNLGNTFATAETLAQPSLSFNAEPGFDPAKTKYSFFMIDPDVPSPSSPVRATFLHWAVSNAQPYCIGNQARRTDTLYQSLTPASVEQHRYTFLVYREPAGYQPQTLALQVRPGFNVNTYAASNGLVLVGGNFLRESIVST